MGIDDFVVNQKDIRCKITDLKEILNVRNGPSYNQWELTFIEDMSRKLDSSVISISQKQREIIVLLWDRI